MCILLNKTTEMHWNHVGDTNKIVGSTLTLACETDHWLKSSSAGHPVLTQNITCGTSGEWSNAQNCQLIRKFKNIVFTTFHFHSTWNMLGVCFTMFVLASFGISTREYSVVSHLKTPEQKTIAAVTCTYRTPLAYTYLVIEAPHC